LYIKTYLFENRSEKTEIFKSGHYSIGLIENSNKATIFF